MEDLSATLLHRFYYLLPPTGHVKLLEIRDHLFLLTSFITPNTHEESHTLMELNRAQLAECFERFALELEDVLNTVKKSDTALHSQH